MTQDNGSPTTELTVPRTKIDRFGWKIADGPGSFEMISVGDLDVDPTYQRGQVREKIRTMARDWSWIGCGAISVARRPNGRYFVMDGQQRTAAALMRKDIEKMPCMIFRVQSIEQEAKGFLAANTLRKPINALYKFKAMVIAGDPIAVKVQELCDSTNVIIVQYGGNDACEGRVKCVNTLMILYRENSEILLKVWPLIIEASKGVPIQDKIVQSLYFIELQLTKQSSPYSLLKTPWRERVLKLGAAGIIAAAQKAAAFYVSGGAKVWATGVVQALNKGTVNRLKIEDGSNP